MFGIGAKYPSHTHACIALCSARYYVEISIECSLNLYCVIHTHTQGWGGVGGSCRIAATCVRVYARTILPVHPLLFPLFFWRDSPSGKWKWVMMVCMWVCCTGGCHTAFSILYTYSDLDRWQLRAKDEYEDANIGATSTKRESAWMGKAGNGNWVEIHPLLTILTHPSVCVFGSCMCKYLWNICKLEYTGGRNMLLPNGPAMPYTWPGGVDGVPFQFIHSCLVCQWMGDANGCYEMTRTNDRLKRWERIHSSSGDGSKARYYQLCHCP